jgi:hypothetical protein
LFNLVDFLSRQPSPPHPIPPPLLSLDSSSHPNLFFWLQNPTLNWDLPFLLLDDIRPLVPSSFWG